MAVGTLHGESVWGAGTTRKDRNRAYRSLPGPDLADLIAGGIGEGRSGWWIGERPDRPRSGDTLAIARPHHIPGEVFRPMRSPSNPRAARVLLSLDTRHPLAAAQLESRDIDFGRSLYAAALRDVLGLKWVEIGDHLVLSDDGSAKSPRRLGEKGRERWRAFGAWPWAALPDGKPPADCWTHGYGQAESLTLQVWRSGKVWPSELAELATGR